MKVNISIDDVSPHPNSSIKVLDRCKEIIEVFPKSKFSLFVPIAYWRTVKPEIATKFALRLDLFPDFCESLKSLSADNFEICYHGFYHGIPGKSDNDEFQHLNESEAYEKFNSMFEIVDKAGLKEIFKPVFRPPAWRMSPSSIKVAEKIGIKTLALSPKSYAKQTYAGAENNFPHVVYYNCNPPFDGLAAHSEVEIVYHACEWDKNHLNQNLTQQLIFWLQNQEKLNFEFMENM
jgi:predicted deacetylase